MIKPKRSLGQNFLVNTAVIEKIIASVQNLKPQNLVEVGPGTGALTNHLVKMNLPLTLVELDRDLAAKWRDEKQNVIEGDALQIDWSSIAAPADTVLVSNLPYQISSSLVIERSLANDGIKAMVLMFQKEVAQRIAAVKSTPDYGLLSVIAQVFWKVDKVCDADPKSFSPAPNVASRVLRFVRRENNVSDRKKFLNFVKLAYSQRRKLLANNLGVAKEIFGACGLKESVRAEELSPEEMVSLWNTLHYKKGTVTFKT